MLPTPFLRLIFVFDNQAGVPDDAWTVTPLGGGNISIKER